MNHRQTWMVGLGLLILGPWTLLDEIQAGGAPPAPASWADQLFSVSGHNFGPVPRGSVVRHSFVLTNHLAEPVTILDIRASCGCTSGWADREMVPPGQRAVVEAQMNTRDFSGQKNTVLFVTLVSASGRQAEARLAVSSLILSDIVLNPGTIDYGAVSRGEAPELALTLERLGAPGWKVERAQMTGNVLEGNISLISSPQDPTTRYALRVRLKPDAPTGIVREEIRLWTNDPETRVIPIPVTAQVLGNLSISPAQVALGSITSAEGAQGRVIVRGKQPFAITEVQGNADGFRLEVPDSSQKKPLHVLTVSYDPSQGKVRGQLNHTFRIFTDLPNESPLEIIATAQVKP